MAQDFFSFLGGMFSNDGGGVPAAVKPVSAPGPIKRADERIAPTNYDGSPASNAGKVIDFLGGAEPAENFIDGLFNPAKSRAWFAESGLTEGNFVGDAVGSAFEPLGEWFARGAIVILGFIFVAVGLAMFGRQPVTQAVSAVKSSVTG